MHWGKKRAKNGAKRQSVNVKWGEEREINNQQWHISVKQ